MAAPKGNKFALGLTTNGRPPKYETPELLAEKVENYFFDCELMDEKPTITGLVLYLGFCSRSSLDDYAKRSKDYSFIIKRAQIAVQNSYEMHGKTIDIFALKNMGWRDKIETEHSGQIKTDGTIKITYK